jgi:UDP-glucose 4-epimerase
VIGPELADDYRGRRVLVTGGLGFIGSTLARALVDFGAEVLLIDSLIPEYGGNRQNIAGIENRLEVHVSDVRDAHALREHVRGRDVIFNLAGQTSHLDSMADPYTDLDINCRAQLSILEVCRRYNRDAKVVFASTRQLYGRPRYLPVDEEHPVAPVDVNGINKAAGEQYHLVYGDVYGIPVSVLRLTNTYGPRMRVRDARQTFLGDWIRRLVTGEEIVVWGDGSQRRDFSYVDDAVRAFLLAAVRDEANGQIYNLGDENHVSLRELAALLADRYGATYRHEAFPSDRKAIDIGDYYSDYTRIRAMLGWQPRVPLEEGLDRTIAFFREHGAGTYWEQAA